MTAQLVVMDRGAQRVAAGNETVAIGRTVVRDTAAAGATMTPAEFFTDIYLRTGPAANFTDTLTTGALMDTQFPDAVVGESWLMNIINGTGAVMNFAAGAGFTFVAGSPTFIAAEGTGYAVITKTGTATWTFELLANAQRPGNLVVKDTAAAGVTITAAELWANVYQRTGPGAPFTDNLPTGTQMSTAYGASTPIGDGWLMEIINGSAVVMTVGAGTNFTFVAGSATTIAAGARVRCQVLRTGANAWTFDILG